MTRVSVDRAGLSPSPFVLSVVAQGAESKRLVRLHIDSAASAATFRVNGVLTESLRVVGPISSVAFSFLVHSSPAP
jgi:hypothetical protein